MMPTVSMTVNASGAAAAARAHQVVVIVDVIDMSTTCEAALDAGAYAVYGAAPDNARCPVNVNPKEIGVTAGTHAVKTGTDVILIAEPRVGTDDERMNNISKVLEGVQKVGAKIGAVLPNIGAETAKLVDFKDRVVIAATGTGGVAFDAAVTAGAPAVLTATVARTLRKKGTAPAEAGVKRALEEAKRLNTGITVVAATANSMEDILAAEYLVKLILMNNG
ncbi:MAG: hypothetical protein H0Z40_06660 [Desulfotomaculum sp.]|nr:hypothetical protein [Desulfotomaculum sp.]